MGKEGLGLEIPCGEVLAEFIFGPGELRFDRAKRPGEQRGNFGVREPLLVVQMDRELFVRGEVAEG